MPRIRIELPERFSFSTRIPLRITDLNYGGHVGNDTILSLIHEARVQYLQSLGYTELDLGGVSLIMADVGIEYKLELFRESELIVEVTAGDFTRMGFDLYYRMSVNVSGTFKEAVRAKTGMVCFDYTARKVVGLPADVKAKME